MSGNLQIEHCLGNLQFDSRQCYFKVDVIVQKQIEGEVVIYQRNSLLEKL